ncbi:unnamed protein product [Natator depressus]
MGPAEKAPRYEAFVSDVLQRDLWRVQQQREEVYEKITQHMWLKTVIERLQEGDGRAVQTQVDLGYNFFVNADVPDTSRIFVALGYGFFAELTLTEALRFVERKTKLLIELSESLTKDSAKIKANIRMVLEAYGNFKGSRTCLRTPEETSPSRTPLPGDSTPPSGPGLGSFPPPPQLTAELRRQLPTGGGAGDPHPFPAVFTCPMGTRIPGFSPVLFPPSQLPYCCLSFPCCPWLQCPVISFEL